MSDGDQVEKFQFLYDVVCDVNKHRDINHVLQSIVVHTQSYFRSDAASIVWIDKDDKQVFCAVGGKHSDELIGLKLPPGEGVSGWVAKHGEFVWIPDVDIDPRFFAGVDGSTGFRTRSILAAPIRQANHVVAILEVVNLPTELNFEEAKPVLIALTTMTEELLERHALLAQSRRYQAVITSVGNPTFLVTEDGELLDVNRAARRIFCLEQSDETTVRFDELGVAELPFIDLVNKISGDESVSWNFTLNKDDPRTYKATLSQVCDDETVMFHWSAYDITEYAALEDSRLHLFNMLVHDLRVPLGSIHHSIELVMTAWKDNDSTIPVEQVLEIASRSEKRMERLISDILDTTRLDLTTKTLTVTTLDIHELVHEAVNTVAPSADRRNHTLNVKMQSDPDTLLGDLDLMQRVLINILGNAVKYTPDAGEINLTVYDDTHNVYFEVSDNGPGILPADKPHIFELFFRGHTNRIKGAGIGLAFSKLAIEAHGGKIWLDPNVAKGAKFVFYIPKVLPENTIFFEG